MKIKRIAIGSDHAGFVSKNRLIPLLIKKGFVVADMGTDSEESCDYPDIAKKVAQSVAAGRFDRGILLCGTGNGMAMAANKVRGIRAALAWNAKISALASEHNWANILCMPSRFVSYAELKKILFGWLKTPHDTDSRHKRRVLKIAGLEKGKF